MPFPSAQYTVGRPLPSTHFHIVSTMQEVSRRDNFPVTLVDLPVAGQIRDADPLVREELGDVLGAWSEFVSGNCRVLDESLSDADFLAALRAPTLPDE